MRRAPAWAVLALACGCAQQVDFVAADEGPVLADAGPYFTDVQVTPPCMAGAYVGEFWTTSAGPFFFAGSLSFELVSLGEDTLTVDNNSELYGKDEGTGAEIDATVTGQGRCRSGEFDSTLSGTFTQTGSAPVTFEGEVDGNYLAESVPGFFGGWKARAFGLDVGEGVWYAVYVPPRPSAP